MRLSLFSLLALAMLANCGTRTALDVAPTTRPRVVVISIDGLMPSSATEMPTLHAMASRGAWSSGMKTVLPSMTYPAHASMVTGVLPAEHGVVSNLRFSPTGKAHGAWRWNASEIKVPTIWQRAHEQGLVVALIGWPSTVGAAVDVVVPDVWQTTSMAHAKRVRANSTPGFIESYEQTDPDFAARWRPPKDDVAAMDLALHALATRDPDLLMVHLVTVDHHQHRDGIDGVMAQNARALVDQQLALLLAALEKTSPARPTIVMVVSDHGFVPLTERVRIGPMLVKHGLLSVDENGRVLGWDATLIADGGGMAMIRLRDESDQVSRTKLAAALAELRTLVPDAITRVMTHDELVSAGGDPDATVGVVARPGVYLAEGYLGALHDAPTLLGGHGYPPELPAMNAVLTIVGDGVSHGEIVGARIIDVAPTVASWLGVPWPELPGAGQPLALPARP